MTTDPQFPEAPAVPKGGPVKRLAYFCAGCVAFGTGAVGIVVPLLPTVPLMILAAFCFARSSPALERRIVEHPAMKPHVLAWREKRAISRKGKAAALLAFAASALLGVMLLEPPMMLLPPAVALVGGAWIVSRPDAGAAD